MRGVVCTCTWYVGVVGFGLIGLMLYARSAEATFGHEHVHIRVHVPEIKNDIHHTEKAIVKEIPVIRQRYKESIAGATRTRTHAYSHHHLRSQLYRDDDDDDDDDAADAGNVRGNNHVFDDDDDDSISYAVAATPPRAAWSPGFHHRNSFAIDDDDAVVPQPATATGSAATSSSYPSRSNLPRLGPLEQRNKPTSASQPLIWYGRPFAASATTSTSIGRDDHDHNDRDDYRYAKTPTWSAVIAAGAAAADAAHHPPVAMVASSKDEKNVSALYKFIKDFAPSMAHPDVARTTDTVAFETFNQVGGGPSDARFRQNFVDYYYHTAPEAIEEAGSFDNNVVEDDDDDDNSNEFARSIRRIELE